MPVCHVHTYKVTLHTYEPTVILHTINATNLVTVVSNYSNTVKSESLAFGMEVEQHKMNINYSLGLLCRTDKSP